MTSSDRPCPPYLHPGGFHEEKVTAAEEGRNLAGVPPSFFTLRNLYVFCLLCSLWPMTTLPRNRISVTFLGLS